MLLDRTISVQLEQFDGPLSLLLYLIQKEEMTLENLDLTQITKQYLDFLKFATYNPRNSYIYYVSSNVFLLYQMVIR